MIDIYDIYESVDSTNSYELLHTLKTEIYLQKTLTRTRFPNSYWTGCFFESRSIQN